MVAAAAAAAAAVPVANKECDNRLIIFSSIVPVMCTADDCFVFFSATLSQIEDVISMPASAAVGVRR